MKLAMQAPHAGGAPVADAQRWRRAVRQQQVWDSVAKTQDRLSAGTGADIRAVASASSLQLALENKKLAEDARRPISPR